MRLLHIIGRRCGMHHIPSWIHPLRQTLNSAALAAGIPAFKAQNHRDPPAVKLTVKLLHLLLQPAKLLLILFLCIGTAQIRLAKNRLLQPVILCGQGRHMLCLLWCFSLLLRFPQLFLQYLNDNLIYLDCRKPPVYRLHNIPRRIIRIRTGQHLFIELFIFIKILMPLQIPFAYAPGSFSRSKEPFKTLLLLLLINCKKYLDHRFRYVRLQVILSRIST